MRRIGVLTSGGDSPGMNAAVMAVAKSARYYGMSLIGIKRGYNGTLCRSHHIEDDMVELDLDTILDIADQPGTYLRTARCLDFIRPEMRVHAANNIREMGIEGVVVIGGDGSFRGAQDLSRHGISCIGIPGTIDNDIACCEQTIGYDTAMNTAMELVDKLRDTSQSHDRCSVVEVMGRHAGYIALNVGIAVGATSILVPEIPYDFEKDVMDRIRATAATGKKHFIIVVAEGVGHVTELAEKIEKTSGIESRATILGHVQRGGSPTLRDRLLASRMGYEAVQLLEAGKSNRVVAIQSDRIVDFDIEEALAMKKLLDVDLYRMAHEISI